MRQWIMLFIPCLSCLGATYYVDFASGNDANAGTSTGTAWKTIPGTRNNGDSAYISTTYGGGTISTSSKVQAGTTFLLHCGTTYTTNIGGKILLNTSYYASDATMANPITIRRDITWDSGSVVIDGTGASIGGGGNGMFHIIVGGVLIDGVGTNGIIFEFSPYDAISSRGVSEIEGPSIWDCTFRTNGTSYNVSENASAGQIQLLQDYGGTIRGCTFDGGGNMFQAISMADSGTRCTNYVVSNCSAWNHQGVNDGGIAFKAQNGQVIWSNCVAWDNYKGWDAGEESSSGNKATVSTWPIRYEVINCTSYSNHFGINFSGIGTSGDTRTNTDFYIINCLVYNNSEIGSKIYAGPFNCYIIHSTYQSNDQVNVTVGMDGLLDTNTINAYIYNCAFMTPATGLDGNVSHVYWSDSASYHERIYEDYNGYVQRASEFWKRFGHYGGGSDQHDFSYGVNGPGHASGTWYVFNSWNNDANSKGTGCSDTTLPPFNSNYQPTNSYAGLNLSGQSWFIPEMGVDRAGRVRMNWDIGAFESGHPNIITGSSVLRNAVLQ